MELSEEIKKEINNLRQKREDLVSRFKKLPRRGSFSGLHLAEEIDKIQKRLDDLETEDNKSYRFYPSIRIEM